MLITLTRTPSCKSSVARALRRELTALKRAEIDAQLAEMVNDVDYQKEVLQMEAEFAAAQWEAFKLAESGTDVTDK